MIGEIGKLFLKSLKRQPFREEIGVSFFSMLYGTLTNCDYSML